MLLIGVFFVPVATYLVGVQVFGDYAGVGFGEFYRDIHSNLRAGHTVVVFLVLAPYLTWQLIRFTFRLFFRLAPGRFA